MSAGWPRMMLYKKLPFSSTSGLGGLIGVAVSAFMYRYCPAFFENFFDRTLLIAYGGAVGESFVRSFKPILLRMFEFAAYWGKLLEVRITFRWGIINQPKYEQIVNNLVDLRFGLTLSRGVRDGRRVK